MEIVKDIFLNIGESLEKLRKMQLSEEKPKTEEGGFFLFFSF